MENGPKVGEGDEKVTRENVLEHESKSPKPIGAKEVFGIVVRAIGLIVALYGVFMLFYGAIILVGGGGPAGMFLIVGCPCAVVGLALLKGQWVVNFAYGSE